MTGTEPTGAELLALMAPDFAELVRRADARLLGPGRAFDPRDEAHRFLAPAPDGPAVFLMLARLIDRRYVAVLLVPRDGARVAVPVPVPEWTEAQRARANELAALVRTVAPTARHTCYPDCVKLAEPGKPPRRRPVRL